MSRPRDPNIYDPGDEPRSVVSQVAGFSSVRQRVGDKAGSRRIGTSVWELLPGQAAYPFHWHYVEEEQLIVIDGTPLLRDAEGWRRLERGAVVAFLPGAGGAHQLVNDGETTVRFLAVSTSGEPDVVHYPEENKIGVFERPPGEGRLRKYFVADSDVSYDEGLQPPPEPPAGL